MRFYSRVFSPDDKRELKNFLSLPQKLYPAQELTQNKKTEAALIRGRHVLSGHFRVYPINVYSTGNIISARCIVTVYDDRDCAYFGFFESIDDDNAARAAIYTASRIASRAGKTYLTGPVNCSFWLGYRLKTDNFSRPYTGEPYNRPYYEKLLMNCGFTVAGEYISNGYRPVPRDFRNEKALRRLKMFTGNGYSIKSPEKSEMNSVMHHVYTLISELYSNFPTFSHISYSEFEKLFSPLKKAADRSMLKMAYFKGTPVGFLISIPDLGSAACGRLTLRKLTEIAKIRRAPGRYIILYVGVKPEHSGLGMALTESARQELARNGAESVGALIMKGKVTGSYFRELQTIQYTYKLFSIKTELIEEKLLKK